jgi:hypothetical protein
MKGRNVMDMALETKLKARRDRQAKGAAVAKAREIANMPTVTAVKEASKRAAVCGKCLRPLKPMEPVKMLTVRARTEPPKDPEFARLLAGLQGRPFIYIEAPVCIACWLTRKREC